jgi:hypothetical protein
VGVVPVGGAGTPGRLGVGWPGCVGEGAPGCPGGVVGSDGVGGWAPNTLATKSMKTAVTVAVMQGARRMRHNYHSPCKAER